MLSVTQALVQLLSEVTPLSIRSCSLAHAHGRILAEDLVSSHDSPPFDVSAMDGFAVRAVELKQATVEQPVVLPVQLEIAAGDRGGRLLEAGHAIRINTGAPIPRGAEAVVKIEDVKLEGSHVKFNSAIQAGTAIRRAGEDYRAGETMLQAGTPLDPAALGLIASLGIAEFKIARPPRVALVSSGDELVEPGHPIGHGQIYNSNRYALIPLLSSWGAEVHDLGCVGDDLEATREILNRGLEYDLIVTTGGVSMGSRDLIRPTLLELGAREIFWKVKQRPGLPIFACVKERPDGSRTIGLGLPGNPVSVFVTAWVYARAALLKMQGASNLELPWRVAVAGADFQKPLDLTSFVRANYGSPPSKDGLPVVVPSRGQGSHQFAALAQSAGIVKLEEGVSGAVKGEHVMFLEWPK